MAIIDKPRPSSNSMLAQSDSVALRCVVREGIMSHIRVTGGPSPQSQNLGSGLIRQVLLTQQYLSMVHAPENKVTIIKGTGLQAYTMNNTSIDEFTTTDDKQSIPTLEKSS
ncbi:hypothetical protein CAPTEDRAFT_220282 [Capitella teleta]|uniref:Uncharacterized protein n=1 Tax=Capitella teleta TaxID=283909 RepID=R7UEL7_CAPTE|nr:hypothetical protein CAPTEDRAFT_220282 [Capitella teleta]|eukprot:ELU04526.1 hypothetical protein CAPTEDRAFT_220282 [Capitella teleta]